MLLLLLTLSVFFWRISSQREASALDIRIVGVVDNKTRPEVEWLVAVPREKNGRAAVLYWRVTIQETNKGDLPTLPLELFANEGKLMEIDLRPKEDGILTWWPGSTLKTGMVYRATGFYYVPSWLEETIASRRLFFLYRFMPKEKPVYATSQWFEVTSSLD